MTTLTPKMEVLCKVYHELTFIDAVFPQALSQVQTGHNFNQSVKFFFDFISRKCVKNMEEFLYRRSGYLAIAGRDPSLFRRFSCSMSRLHVIVSPYFGYLYIDVAPLLRNCAPKNTYKNSDFAEIYLRNLYYRLQDEGMAAYITPPVFSGKY